MPARHTVDPEQITEKFLEVKREHAFVRGRT
jgi:hypothetical protein